MTDVVDSSPTFKHCLTLYEIVIFRGLSIFRHEMGVSLPPSRGCCKAKDDQNTWFSLTWWCLWSAMQYGESAMYLLGLEFACFSNSQMRRVFNRLWGGGLLPLAHPPWRTESSWGKGRSPASVLASAEGTPGARGFMLLPADGLGRCVPPGPSPLPRSPPASLLHLPCPPSLAGAGQTMQCYLADLLFLIFILTFVSLSYEKLKIYLQSVLCLPPYRLPPCSSLLPIYFWKASCNRCVIWWARCGWRQNRSWARVAW